MYGDIIMSDNAVREMCRKFRAGHRDVHNEWGLKIFNSEYIIIFIYVYNHITRATYAKYGHHVTKYRTK